MFTDILLATLLCVAQPQTPPDTAKLDQFFARLAEKGKAMGSLTVVKDGKVVYARVIGYGRIDGTAKDPLTAASRFRIGSITKTFTAAMVLQLVDEGKLKLTDTLDQFCPQVPNARTITVAHLLAHRSGVPNVQRDGPNANTLPLGRDEMLALIAKGKPDFEPDAKFRYSNSGYQLLGLIIERVTGKPYGEALRDRITSKVGLKDTYLATGAIDGKKNEALTYMRLGKDWKPVPETHPSVLFSGGGVVSTPGDLAAFAQALFDGKVVSKESLDRMRTIRDGDEMGLGMERYKFAGKTFYGHAGGADNYGAWLAYLPEERLAVAYTTNAKVYPVENIVRGVIDVYYGKPFTVPALESVAVAPEVLDKYVGEYTNPDAAAKLTITRDGGTLFFKPPGAGSAVPLEATAETKFQIEGVVVIEFDVAKGRMTVKRRGGERVFTKEK
jgi:CubicO group peptidase (beta-lactamase class C family)